MLRNLTEYHWAEHIDDALLLLARLDVRTVPIAGGTSLLASHDENIEAVVDLRDLELSTISEDARGTHIGAMATLQQLTHYPLLSTVASGIVAQAAHCSSPSHTIRNSATVGGTLALGAASHADLLTVFTALEAQAVVRSGSRTEVSLNGGMLERSTTGFSGIVYKGKQERRLDCASVSRELLPNELIIDVVIPRVDQETRGAFVRISETPTGAALLNVALVVAVEQEQLRRVRIVFGGGEMEPMRCVGVEQLLEGQSIRSVQHTQNLDALLQKGLTAFRFTTDTYASSGYRKATAIQLMRQAFEEVLPKTARIHVDAERV
jgi:CO/xanthine dehydrogenase FAD-binding subunit